jgi:hypothetical protein
VVPGYTLTFTQEFMMDLIMKLMDTSKERKISYVSFEPSHFGNDVALIVKYKEKVAISLDEALGGKSEWVDQRIVLQLNKTYIDTELDV